jgi:hypothetical protein
MAGDTRSHHQFVVSNDAGVVIRCCIHCGLSHQMESYQDQRTNRSRGVWSLILEEREDETFAEPCPGESGSDDLFPYHHFILSNHHKQSGGAVVIRFCVRCGLSHHLVWASPYTLAPACRPVEPVERVVNMRFLTRAALYSAGTKRTFRESSTKRPLAHHQRQVTRCPLAHHKLNGVSWLADAPHKAGL